MQNYINKLIAWWHLRNTYLHVAADIGPKRDTHPVVILHGIASSSQYALLYRDVLPKNRRIIFLDLLGYGESPKIDRFDYSMAAHSTALLRTLQKLSITHATVVGYSMGALIAVYSGARSRRIKNVICCSMPLFSYEKSGHFWHKIIARLYDGISQKQSAALRMTHLIGMLPNRFKGFQLNEDTWPAFSSNMSNIISTYNPLNDVKKISSVSVIVGKLDPFVSVKATKCFADDAGITDVTVVQTPLHTIDATYMNVISKKL